MNGHGSDDFGVDIHWVGAQDKPYYAATFVSEANREKVADSPFHGVTVISSDELIRIAATLREHGVTLAPGQRKREDANEYVVDIWRSGEELSGSLGDERRSIPVLAALRDALVAEHRRPLDDVLNRLRGWMDA